MSGNSGGAVNIGISVESLDRRLRNVELKRKKEERTRQAKGQQSSNESVGSIDGEEPPRQQVAPNPEQDGDKMDISSTSQDRHYDLDTDDAEAAKYKDLAFGIQPDASSDYSMTSREARMHDAMNDPNTKFYRIQPHEYEEMDARWKELYPDEQIIERSSSNSSVLSGYIPPPEKRSPGGTRKWTLRDWQAGRMPHQLEAKARKAVFDAHTVENGEGHSKWAASPFKRDDTQPSPQFKNNEEFYAHFRGTLNDSPPGNVIDGHHGSKGDSPPAKQAVDVNFNVRLQVDPIGVQGACVKLDDGENRALDSRTTAHSSLFPVRRPLLRPRRRPGPDVRVATKRHITSDQNTSALNPKEVKMAVLMAAAMFGLFACGILVGVTLVRF